MIGRLLYHSFWNIYDHLFVLLLAGVVHGIGLTALAAVAFGISPGFLNVGLILVAVIGALVLTGLVMAGLLGFCKKAAHGTQARWPDFVSSLRQNWGRSLMLLLLFTIGFLICGVNFRFYLGLNGDGLSSVIRLVLMFFAGVSGWMIVLLMLLSGPVFAAAAQSPAAEEQDTTAFRFSLRTVFRRALLALALTPGVWVFLLLGALVFFVLCYWSKIGLLIYLPIMTMTVQTTFFLSMQLAEYLAQAREELGEKAGLRELKNRATQHALKWELDQPRRTVRELIKPWEH